VTRGYIGLQLQSVTPDPADGLGLKDAKGALVLPALRVAALPTRRA
jgi:S1-C subfamily serine protease